MSFGYQLLRSFVPLKSVDVEFMAFPKATEAQAQFGMPAQYLYNLRFRLEALARLYEVAVEMECYQIGFLLPKKSHLGEFSLPL